MTNAKARVTGVLLAASLLILGGSHPLSANDGWVRLGTVSTAAPPQSFSDFRRLFDLVPQAARAHVFRFSDHVSPVGVAILDHAGCAVEDLPVNPQQDGTRVPREGCPVAVGFAGTAQVRVMAEGCFFAPAVTSDEDRRRNGVYARYDAGRKLVMLRTVVDGSPLPQCDAMFSVRVE